MAKDHRYFKSNSYTDAQAKRVRDTEKAHDNQNSFAYSLLKKGLPALFIMTLGTFSALRCRIHFISCIVVGLFR